MDDEFWLDNSKLETFRLCPQKYAYRFEEHLLPVDRKRDSALMFGGAIHRSLETLYKGTAFNKVPCPLGPCARCRGAEIQHLVAVFLDNYTDDPLDPREVRSVDRGLELLALYLTKWRREPFKVIAVEVPFELERHAFGIFFKYIGRIDLIVDQDSIPMTVDHKTTTRFGMLFDSSFKLSGQFTGYMKGATKLLGREVNTALANAMRITTKIDDSSFARIYTHRMPEEFELWDREVNAAAAQIYDMRDAKFFPRSAPFACGAYNRMCDYYPLCIASAQTRVTLKETAYEVVPWEPRRENE